LRMNGHPQPFVSAARFEACRFFRRGNIPNNQFGFTSRLAGTSRQAPSVPAKSQIVARHCMSFPFLQERTRAYAQNPDAPVRVTGRAHAAVRSDGDSPDIAAMSAQMQMLAREVPQVMPLKATQVYSVWFRPQAVQQIAQQAGRVIALHGVSQLYLD